MTEPTLGEPRRGWRAAKLMDGAERRPPTRRSKTGK